jgi:hypothetical protein
MQMLAGFKPAPLHFLAAPIYLVTGQTLLAGRGQDTPTGRPFRPFATTAAIAGLRESFTGQQQRRQRRNQDKNTHDATPMGSMVIETHVAIPSRVQNH